MQADHSQRGPSELLIRSLYSHKSPVSGWTALKQNAGLAKMLGNGGALITSLTVAAMAVGSLMKVLVPGSCSGGEWEAMLLYFGFSLRLHSGVMGVIRGLVRGFLGMVMLMLFDYGPVYIRALGQFFHPWICCRGLWQCWSGNGWCFHPQNMGRHS